MDNKIEIKEENPFSEVISQTKGESLSQDVTMKLNGDATVWDKVSDVEIKPEIKEEALASDFCSPNHCQKFSENPLLKLSQCNDNSEMEIKREIKEESIDSYFHQQNERQLISKVPVVHSGKSYELDTKIEIKEELCWLEGTSTEDPCADDATKNWVDESLPSTESLRLYREAAFIDKSCVLFDENCEKNTRFSIEKNSCGSETTRKHTCKKTDVLKTTSVQTGEQHDRGQMLNKSSYLTDNNLVQVHDFNKKNCESVLDRDNKIGKYKCDTCEKRFTSPSDLKRHKFIHEDQKPHQCDICEKSFAQLSHLKRHNFAHQGIKPHKCNICGKCFTGFTDLNRHQLTHKGIRPHKCDICGNCFTQLPHLKSHKLIHEGIKPHKCDTCEKRFARFSQLKIHKLIHEAIKPHKCNTCGKCFSRLPHLKRHKLIH